MTKQDKFGLSWLTNRKERWKDSPHMRLESLDKTWKSRVVKTWQPGNEGKLYARWMMAIESPHTYGSEDLGDTYITDVLLATSVLVEVDGRKPTNDEQLEWAEFRSRFEGKRVGDEL